MQQVAGTDAADPFRCTPTDALGPCESPLELPYLRTTAKAQVTISTATASPRSAWIRLNLHTSTTPMWTATRSTDLVGHVVKAVIGKNCWTKTPNLHQSSRFASSLVGQWAMLDSLVPDHHWIRTAAWRGTAVARFFEQRSDESRRSAYARRAMWRRTSAPGLGGSVPNYRCRNTRRCGIRCRSTSKRLVPPKSPLK